MNTNSELEIRILIESWAKAVRAKDIDGVSADHTDDIVMFDVPPPVQLKGIDAYRKTWPDFFSWQRKAEGSFDIAEIDITAGTDVAFATAVLLCASKEARSKGTPPTLRLTIGLRRENGAWQIAHEHHSFPLDRAA